MATTTPTNPTTITAAPLHVPQPVNALRVLVADTLAQHHAVTIHLGGHLYVWVCGCGAPGSPRTGGATTQPVAYEQARVHTAQAILDALTRAGLL
ncbi:hypothetical protein ABZ671_18805 [Micromonospora sp. NPDC006766]|uniref:hypothetical protein n=1 Tax=Micromonospora sp. NPDC006766 TaxID=3154778 RepID=UPI0033D38B60